MSFRKLDKRVSYFRLWTAMVDWDSSASSSHTQGTSEVTHEMLNLFSKPLSQLGIEEYKGVGCVLRIQCMPRSNAAWCMKCPLPVYLIWPDQPRHGL